MTDLSTFLFLDHTPPAPIHEFVASNEVSPTNEYLIRYEGSALSFDRGERELKILKLRFPVMRRTKQCYAIDNWGKTRFVGFEGRKRFAYPDDALAKESFRIRCDWRIRYAQSSLTNAQDIDALRRELLDGVA